MSVAALTLVPLAILVAAGAAAGSYDDELARARELFARQDYAGAEETAREARALARASGGGPLETAAANDLLVSAQHALGRGGSDECLALAHESVSLKSSAAAEPGDLQHSRRLVGLTLLYRQELEMAEAALREVAAFWDGRSGTDPAEAARAERDLGGCLAARGEDREAARHLARAVELARAGGEDDLVPYLYNQARVAVRAGDHAGATATYEQALDLELGRKEVRAIRAFLLNGLAIVHYEQERFTPAQENFEAALEAARVSLPPGHPFVALTENNLGNLLREVGDYEGAAHAYTVAAAALEEIHGRNHTYVAMALANLATTRMREGQLEEALLLHSEALEIKQAVLGSDHPDVATSHYWLAEILLELGRTAEASAEIARVLGSRTATLGSAHAETALALTLRGRIRLAAEQPNAALEDLEAALATQETSLGPAHPECAETRRLIAVTLRALERPPEALEQALRAESIARDHGRIVAATMSERLALRHAAIRTSGLDVALALLGDLNDGSAPRVWDALIRSRALVLDETMLRRRQMVEVASAKSDSLVADYTRQSRKLAALLVEGSGGPGYAEEVRRATEQRDRTERELASAGGGLSGASRLAGFDEVAAALPAGAALVAYVHFLDETPRGAGGYYGAFVLRSDRSATFLVLGDASSIDGAVASWRKAVASGAPVRKSSRALTDLIWRPFASELRPAPMVFVVPDASLNQVAFPTLSDGDWLLATGPLLHLLATERDLVAREKPAARGTGLLAIGGPDFGTPDTTGAAGTAMWFVPLPAAEEEARAIAARWDAAGGGESVLLVGSEATETRFKRETGGRSVVHLATHGFIVGASPGPPSAPFHRGIGGLGGLPPGRDRARPGLSGLAFASANLASAPGSEDDGILTALEIAALDLRAADWVVLSACDTGLGAVQAGEGVLGLRRSFEAAGVGTLVMSLWPVEDRVARIWMEELYEARFARGLPTAQAVRAAGLATLEWEKRERGHDHPSAWGSFVAVGDWR